MFLSPAEKTVIALGIIVLLAGAIYTLCRWVLAGPHTPDPWDSELDQALEKDEAVPVCPHCLTPQSPNGWFCPGCGSTSGQYGAYLPAVAMFSVGDAARSGIYLPGRWNFLIVTGYFLLACAVFSVLLAPLYCLALLIRRSMAKEQMSREGPPPLPAA